MTIFRISVALLFCAGVVALFTTGYDRCTKSGGAYKVGEFVMECVK